MTISLRRGSQSQEGDGERELGKRGAEEENGMEMRQRLGGEGVRNRLAVRVETGRGVSGCFISRGSINLPLYTRMRTRTQPWEGPLARIRAPVLWNPQISEHLRIFIFQGNPLFFPMLATVLKEKHLGPGLVVFALNPSTQEAEAEAGGSLRI